ncbi:MULTISPECIES: hypothetical protein [unclassified Mesorhizobium]|uniref:hypothetical protein n=1 Tax=unclassified Mesorhizobium TaxID=325217 RepID=UPI000F75A51E|nr:MULTISPECIES: hypothetical protein [unclassified Mesorhizobium]AZO05255.1 hypothetical protein EJ068_20935 [Mesorhizobium sp. M2A.F.Ca.ET.043.02.1.1]RUW42560.1 hypothetical protein EOA37_04350 [Mesorhizobium sp. M2A.F.Ca.ET.015.02.1.1]RUW73643.1 hypothetical protein EOA28_18330 [Mesorhizobium sp. M2A.F.Ca.ET.067.02.1.1]RVC93197.1 hypothetical protein EN739_22330 [Mesorhizobium sp. M2A.F.Ca.ET.017.03.2.1]RVD11262.1 hypothetical protein EN753_03225 [Mesorhizobium sp. M2A.F.Ca.ET.029.05.1.1]
MERWDFEDPPNVAVLSVKGIFRHGDWIAYVVHENDDDDDDNDERGSWQFYSSDTRDRNESDMMLVGLQEVVDRDKSILELADLPKGWHAWRSSRSSPWQRAKSRPLGLRDDEWRP